MAKLSLRRSKPKQILVRCAGCGHEVRLTDPRCPHCGGAMFVPLHL